MEASSSRRIVRHVALVAAVALGPVVTTASAAAPTAAAETTCRTAWGSQAEGQAARPTGEVTGVRSGRHTCFDRLVVDLGRGAERPGFRVRYVDAVHEDGSGTVVPLRGGARLRVVVLAPAYDEQGAATYVPADRRELVDVTAYDTFRQAAWAGTFEGRTTLGLGVRARLPFRVFTLDGPGTGSRLVVDVAHTW